MQALNFAALSFVWKVLKITVKQQICSSQLKFLVHNSHFVSHF